MRTILRAPNPGPVGSLADGRRWLAAGAESGGKLRRTWRADVVVWQSCCSPERERGGDLQQWDTAVPKRGGGIWNPGGGEPQCVLCSLTKNVQFCRGMLRAVRATPVLFSQLLISKTLKIPFFLPFLLGLSFWALPSQSLSCCELKREWWLFPCLSQGLRCSWSPDQQF